MGGGGGVPGGGLENVAIFIIWLNAHDFKRVDLKNREIFGGVLERGPVRLGGGKKIEVLITFWDKK